MVAQAKPAPIDLSSLIRDSLKSFNRLKCSIDDMGSDVRPFYERNLHVDESTSLEHQYSSTLKYHSLSSTQGYYGIGADTNLHHQLETFKNQNERYLDELVNHLSKNKKIVNPKNIDKSKNTLTSNFQSDELTDLIQTYNNNTSKNTQNINTSKNTSKNAQNKCINYNINTNSSNEKDWDKFKSDYTSKYSEFYFKVDTVNPKSSEVSLINNERMGANSSRLRKNNDFTKNNNVNIDQVKFESKDSLPLSKQPINNTKINNKLMEHAFCSVQRTKLEITVNSPHSILFKKENCIVNNVSLNVTLLEFLYIEEIIQFNNLRKGEQTNFATLDSHQNFVVPVIDKVCVDNNYIIPYAEFVASNFDGYVECDDTMVVDNWLLLGRQLTLLREINIKDDQLNNEDDINTNAQNTEKVEIENDDNDDDNDDDKMSNRKFQDIVIETAWNHLCLREKRRLMQLTRKEYHIEDTVDIIFNYYCDEDKFYPRDCRSIKQHILWKCIYSAIRCGNFRAAATFAEGLYLENVVFIQYIQAFANNQSNNLNELRDALLELYTFEDDSKLTIKRFVLSFLLNLNDVNMSMYFQNLDDLLWFKIAKAYFFREDPLSTIQSHINDIILSKFQSDSPHLDPLAVVQALLYCGNYVSCINYLRDFPALYPHMVNLAIALFTEGRISLNDSSNQDLVALTKSSNLCSLDLKDIFLRYIQQLNDINVDLAIEYIYVFKGLDNDLVVSFMSQISLVTQNISRLFGNILPDGSHTDCLLNLFEGQSAEILNNVARALEKNNDLYNSIRIYDISADYKKVVKLINKMLCETICLTTVDRKRKKIFETANYIFNRMVEQNWNIDFQRKILFEFLHDYLWLENLMKVNDLMATLEVTDNCRFIPTNNESLYDFQKLVKNLPPVAFRFLGNFIRSVATVYYQQYVATVDRVNRFCFKNQDSTFIKNKMRNLVRMVTQMCDESIIPSDAMQAVLLLDNKIMC